MKKTIKFTKIGLENLKKEYKSILDTKEGAIQTLSRARELGDLSENGFYKAAKAKVFFINASLNRLGRLIKSAEVIGKPLKGIADIGSKIILRDGKNIREFSIVGKYEADPKNGKISDESPVGKALIGKKTGDIIKVKIPNGEITYKILKIDVSIFV